MKYMIEFDLPDNDTVLREIKTADVAWGIWGYSGCTKAKPAQQTALTADDIEIIRIHLSAFKEELCNQGRWAEAAEYERLILRLTGKGGQDSTDYPLKEIPPGHWTDKGSLSCRCSECGCKSPKEYPYCPNCGTPMEK